MQASIMGVWTLRSFHMENVDTGERSEPFGHDPCGTLMLHPDGRLVALLTPRARLPDPSQAAQASTFPIVAYSGRYRLEPPDQLVTAVDVASFETWLGTDQARTYKLDGDTLEVATPPGRMPRPDGTDVPVIGILSWTREGPAD